MASRLLSGRTVLRANHMIMNRNLISYHRRNISIFDVFGEGRFTQFFFAIGAATFGSALLYKTIWGSFKEQKIVEKMDELQDATTKAVEYYQSGEPQEKYENWKENRATKKKEKKEQRKENMSEKIDDLKQNIDSGIKLFKDVKTSFEDKLQSDEKE